MANELFKVTATALNLRASPGRDAALLSVLRQGQIIIASGAVADGWLPVLHEGKSGFVAASYVRPTTQTIVAAGALPLAAAPSVTTGSASDVERKDRELAHLHPKMRDCVMALLEQLRAETLPFQVFEAFRTPQRQQWLYAQSRTRPGSMVTKSQAWQSFHQYGLAVDLVLFVHGNWSWDDKGARRAQWSRMRELAAGCDLRTLNWEMPHVELPVSLADASHGALLESGDASWRDHLARVVTGWRAVGGADGPDIEIAERPALAADEL